jgi:hypothetical protein
VAGLERLFSFYEYVCEKRFEENCSLCTHTHTHTHTLTHARASLYVTLGFSELSSNLGKNCVFGRESDIVNNLGKFQAILNGKYVATCRYIFLYLLFNQHITLCTINVINDFYISRCSFHLESLSSYLSKSF